MTVPPCGDQSDRVGRFRVTAVLGSGSFGTVYLGVDPMAGSPVAVKVFDRDRSDETAFTAALRSEADAMRRIHDRHCVRVIDIVDEPEVTAIVTELIDGASLRAVLSRAGRLTGPQALDVMRGALLGLTAVHAAGLVHGDIKPDNILVDRRGVSRLIDFGLTRDQGTKSADGTVAGSPAYMSPEQLRGQTVDGRSDIYACAALLFELLTGRQPYVASRVIDVAKMHLTTEAPDPRKYEPTLTHELAQLCMKGLAKKPADRYPTAADFLSALEQAARQRYGAVWRAGLGLGALVGAVAGLAGRAAALEPAAPHTATANAGPVPHARIAHGRSTSAVHRISHLGRFGASAAAAATAVVVAVVAVVVVVSTHTPTRRAAITTTAAAGGLSANTSQSPADTAGSLRSWPATRSTLSRPAAPATAASTTGPTTGSTTSFRSTAPTTDLGRFTSPRLTITARSLGDVQLGMSLPKAERAAGVIFDGKGDGAFYSTTLPTGFLHLFVDGDPVGCVGAEPGSSPRRQIVTTSEGVELGDNTRKLLRIYGTRAHYLPAPPSGLNPRAGYVVRMADGNLGFALDPAGTTIVEISGSALDANPINCNG